MDEDDPHAEGAAVVAAARESLQALCQELNLDKGSAAEALDDFTAIRGNYSLEGEFIHWLACSCMLLDAKASFPQLERVESEASRGAHLEGCHSAALRKPGMDQASL
ncbi:hypothetical protein JEQ12_008412 [Ovis aries]|uniref:Uncharacterized protein n=1 Tax=Ovis aries TaxID=9940 RepID=A0A835ZPE4_SHEEP|nr:hypothetical protein JEQ12_008412 [Ovis aries]